MKSTLRLIPMVFLFAALVPAAIAYLHAANQTSPIAYVSVQRVLSESTAAKADAAHLLAMQQQKAQELRQKQQALEATQQQLGGAAGVFRGQQLRQQAQQQRADLERATAQAQSDLQSLQRQLQTDFRRRLKSALDDLVKRQGVQLVLNEDTAVVWTAPGSDLTAAVIERLNAVAAAATAAKPQSSDGAVRAKVGRGGS